MWEMMTEAGIDPARMQVALQNPTVSVGRIEKSLFDLTEETDALSSAYLFARVRLSSDFASVRD